MKNLLNDKTESEKEDILELIKSGTTYQEIADIYNLSISSVSTFALENGVRRRNRVNKLTEMQKQELKPLLENRTESYTALGRRYGVPRYVIRNFADKLHLSTPEHNQISLSRKKKLEKAHRLLDERDNGSGKTLREIGEEVGYGYHYIRILNMNRKKDEE